MPGADAVLLQLATLLANTVSAGEFVGRFGGDRFLVVASNTALDEARALADRMAKTIKQASFRYKDQVIQITASFGIAVARPPVPCEQAEFVAVEEGGVSSELQPFIRWATDDLDRAKSLEE
jgi:diguanylate cyclase (GGDEF)-like protein